MAKYSAQTERWRTLVAKYFPANLVDKALYVIEHESGGNPSAAGDGGHARGLFQVQAAGSPADPSGSSRPPRDWLDDPENNIKFAAENLGAANGEWSAWGEGVTYQGKPFGALGNAPYPGDDGKSTGGSSRTWDSAGLKKLANAAGAKARKLATGNTADFKRKAQAKAAAAREAQPKPSTARDLLKSSPSTRLDAAAREAFAQNGVDPDTIAGIDSAGNIIYNDDAGTLKRKGFMELRPGLWYNPNTDQEIDLSDPEELDREQLDEGRRQFDKQFDRSIFESDREFEQAREEFATQFLEGQRQFDLGLSEEQRQFDIGEEGVNRRFDIEQGGIDRRFDTGLAEDARQFDIGEAGTNRRFDIGEAGTNRRFDVTEGRLGRQLDLETELGRGELALGQGRLGLDTELGRGRLDIDRGQLGVNQKAQVAQEAEARGRLALDAKRFRADVLSRPSDYIAGSFERSGMVSPGTAITQADLLGDLNSMPVFARGGYTTEPAFITGDLEGNSRSGELNLNPTRAPIKVLNNRQTRGLMGRGGRSRGRFDLGGQMDNFMPREPMQSQRFLGDPGQPGTGFDMEQVNAITAATDFRDPNQPVPLEDILATLPVGQQFANDPNMQFGARTPFEDVSGSRFGIPRYAEGTVDPYVKNQTVWDEAGVQHAVAPLPGQDATFLGEADRLYNTDRQAYAQYINRLPKPRANPLTQNDYIERARRFSPPDVSSALAGRRMSTYRPSTPGLTLQKIAALDPGEREALNSRLAVEFNRTLEDEIAGLQSRFGPAVTRPRARFVG